MLQALGWGTRHRSRAKKNEENGPYFVNLWPSVPWQEIAAAVAGAGAEQAAATSGSGAALGAAEAEAAAAARAISPTPMEAPVVSAVL